MSEVRNIALDTKLLLLRLGTGPLSMSSLPFIHDKCSAHPPAVSVTAENENLRYSLLRRKRSNSLLYREKSCIGNQFCII